MRIQGGNEERLKIILFKVFREAKKGSERIPSQSYPAPNQGGGAPVRKLRMCSCLQNLQGLIKCGLFTHWPPSSSILVSLLQGQQNMGGGGLEQTKSAAAHCSPHIHIVQHIAAVKGAERGAWRFHRPKSLKGGVFCRGE